MRKLSLILALLASATAACSSTESANAPTAGSSSHQAGGGATSGAAGAGQPAGGAGTGGTGGAPLAGGGAGGAVTSGGAAGLGGGGGQAGAAGGVTEDARLAAQVLDGFALLKPCVSSFTPSGDASNMGDCCCEETAESENQHITKQFGGDPNLIYEVTVRIAGVAERYWYAEGTLAEANEQLYVGGFPTIHSASAPNANLNPGQGACKVHPPETDGQFALPFTVPDEIRPKDGCYNGFNIFAMTVSSANGKQSYYLNYTTDFDGADRQPHSVYETDYTATISIPSQAQLDFYTIDGDHHQVTNNGTMSVPDLKTPQPFNGNFLEFTVLEVSASTAQR